MGVHIARLLKALHRTLWRNGHVKPENLKHVVDAKGDHTISLVIAAEDADYDAPRTGAGWDGARFTTSAFDLKGKS